MKKLLPFVLILVAMGSGCTVPILNIEIPGLPDIPGFGGPTVVQYEHDIVVINSLEAIPAEIDAGQTTKLIAYIQNNGDKSIEETITVELYDYCQGLFNIPKVMCEGSEKADTECEINGMLPDEIVRVVWTLEQDESNPVKLRTICPPDGMKVSVTYPYTTSSLTTISFISKAELERTLEQREYRSTESYIVVGQGPIKPYLTVEDKQPVPVYNGARTMLQLVVKNAGSGNLASKFKDSKGNDVVGLEKGEYITVKGIGSDGLKPISDTECKLGGKVNEDVRLIGKQSAPLTCRIDLSDLEQEVIKTATRHLEVSIDDYEYTFIKTVQVVVNPKFTG